MKRIVPFVFTIIMLLVIGLPTMSVKANSEGIQEIESIENYVNYLENLATEDPGAEKVLEKFLKLSEKEKELFLEALQPENYIKIMQQTQKNINEKINFQVNGGIVPVEMKADMSESPESYSENEYSIQSTYRVTTPWAISPVYLFGIKTSEFRLRMIYQSNGTSPLQIYDVERQYYNYNPGIWTTSTGFTSRYISGGDAFGGYMWTLHSTGTFGFLSTNYDMYIKVRPGSGYYQIISGHPNLGHGWIKFF